MLTLPAVMSVVTRSVSGQPSTVHRGKTWTIDNVDTGLPLPELDESQQAALESAEALIAEPTKALAAANQAGLDVLKHFLSRHGEFVVIAAKRLRKPETINWLATTHGHHSHVFAALMKRESLDVANVVTLLKIASETYSETLARRIPEAKYLKAMIDRVIAAGVHIDTHIVSPELLLRLWLAVTWRGHRGGLPDHFWPDLDEDAALTYLGWVVDNLDAVRNGTFGVFGRSWRSRGNSTLISSLFDRAWSHYRLDTHPGALRDVLTAGSLALYDTNYQILSGGTRTTSGKIDLLRKLSEAHPRLTGPAILAALMPHNLDLVHDDGHTLRINDAALEVLSDVWPDSNIHAIFSNDPSVTAEADPEALRQYINVLRAYVTRGIHVPNPDALCDLANDDWPSVRDLTTAKWMTTHTKRHRIEDLYPHITLPRFDGDVDYLTWMLNDEAAKSPHVLRSAPISELNLETLVDTISAAGLAGLVSVRAPAAVILFEKLCQGMTGTQIDEYIRLLGSWTGTARAAATLVLKV